MNNEKIKKPFNKMKAMCTTASIAAVTSIMTPMVLAIPDTDMDSVVGKVVGIVVKVFKYIGVLLLAWSIGMLVLAFKNEDADSKSRAMMLLVVSIALIGIGTLMTAVGIDFEDAG